MKIHFAFLLGAVAALSACQTTGKMAWQYYDECAAQYASFKEIASCGKQTRNAGCAADKTCSGRGNALVQYADSLVASIKAGELSEPEAKRKWIEYRTAEENAYTQDRNAERARRSAINSSQAIREAVSQSSRPILPQRQINCSPMGTGYSCY